jgi:hypothetical protein
MKRTGAPRRIIPLVMFYLLRQPMGLRSLDKIPL